MTVTDFDGSVRLRLLIDISVTVTVTFGSVRLIRTVYFQFTNSGFLNRFLSLILFRPTLLTFLMVSHRLLAKFLILLKLVNRKIGY